MNLREQFENQALNNQMLNRQQMTRAFDSLSQQMNLGNPQREQDIFELNQGGDQPSINIKITGMLNDAMTKPLPKRKGKPSIDIQIS
jgi:hypothetical protein